MNYIEFKNSVVLTSKGIHLILENSKAVKSWTLEVSTTAFIVKVEFEGYTHVQVMAKNAMRDHFDRMRVRTVDKSQFEALGKAAILRFTIADDNVRPRLQADIDSLLSERPVDLPNRD